MGWLGTAVTGPTASTAALFGNLQANAAGQVGSHTHLRLGVNEIGGGLGKIVPPQNLTIAAGVIEEPGSEPELLKTAGPWSLLVLGRALTGHFSGLDWRPRLRHCPLVASGSLY